MTYGSDRDEDDMGILGERASWLRGRGWCRQAEEDCERLNPRQEQSRMNVANKSNGPQGARTPCHAQITKKALKRAVSVKGHATMRYEGILVDF